MIDHYSQVYELCLAIVLLAAPIIFITLLFVTAPYGRHYQGGWGLKMNNQQAWFYMELPAILTIAYWFLISDQADPIYWIFILLWQFHYFYRTIIFPLKLQPTSKSFPLVLVLSAIIFNLLNGTVNGLYLFHLSDQYSLSSSLSQPSFWIGMMLFVCGFIIHYRSDQIILNLRRKSSTQYSIPQGFLFKYVTNPNYFGEFLQWSGWAMLTWSFAGLSFALFTLANLLPRAISNHRWYKNQFEHYPERKVFFPFLF